jgi:hypothetical protein
MLNLWFFSLSAVQGLHMFLKRDSSGPVKATKRLHNPFSYVIDFSSFLLNCHQWPVTLLTRCVTKGETHSAILQVLLPTISAIVFLPLTLCIFQVDLARTL